MGEEFLENRKIIEELMLFSLSVPRHACHDTKDLILEKKYIPTKRQKRISRP